MKVKKKQVRLSEKLMEILYILSKWSSKSFEWMCSGVNTLFWNPQEFGRISFNTSSTQCKSGKGEFSRVQD